MLTSDCEANAIKKLGYEHDNNEYKHFNNSITLGQSPHHGSNKNHNKIFWRNRVHEKNTPILFSVGENSYGHPSTEVVKNFRQVNYEPFSTNHVGGLIDLPSTITSAVEARVRGLRVIGRKIKAPIINSKLNGDKVFELGLNTFKYVAI